MTKKLITSLLLLLSVSVFAQNKDFDFLTDWPIFSDNQNSQYHHYSAIAMEQLQQRKDIINSITTPEQWLQRQQQVRQTLMDIVGPFPEKTPLNAQVTGKVKKNGFTIEKVIFESRPEFYVTCALLLPDKLQKKNPAVIFVCGHSAVGFRSEAYQRSIQNLAKKGFIVLAVDPFGQGERWQYFDPETGESKIGGPTREHSYSGAQCFISGSSAAKYMIWDGIRAVDYLLTRKEVDPKRIGITGRSGGGTQSSYIAAFDERIYAAAPECYLTGFKRLIESRGPQDAEQNFFHGLANGIDHADLLEVRAPKPELLISTTRDMFSIQGVREISAEIKSCYAMLGATDNFEKCEDNDVHASTKKNREAMYAFFRKHLELPGNCKDEEPDPYVEEEWRVTKTGQLITSLGGETVFSVNAKESKQLISALDEKRKAPEYPENMVRAAKSLSGYTCPESPSFPAFTGRFEKDGYVIERYFIQGNGDYVIPYLLYKPVTDQPCPSILYLSPEGKSYVAESGTPETLVKQGNIVMVPDLLGIGEMGPIKFHGDAYDFKVGNGAYNIWFFGILTNKSLVGMFAQDIQLLSAVLKQHENVDPAQIKAVAKDKLCPSLVHAAVFNPVFSNIELDSPLTSYESIVMNEYYDPALIHGTVAGALTSYDLPDLMAAIAPTPLKIMNPVDHNSKAMDKSAVQDVLKNVEKLYKDSNAENNLTIVY